ncbi:MAG: hypothetical protein KGJ90_04435 [Patescibacteria group bacterium]|nr:hypothetical protein [Patescibacteria group bacterium]
MSKKKVIPENHRLCRDGLVRVWEITKLDGFDVQQITKVYDPDYTEEKPNGKKTPSAETGKAA